MPYYFASFEEIIIDYSIIKVQNKKGNCPFHIYMLKLYEGCMNVTNVQ